MTEIHSFGQLPIISHAWNKDRSQLAVSLGKSDVRIYEKKKDGKWTLIHTLCEHLSRVLAIDWAPNTNRIITAGSDCNTYVWTFEQKTWKKEMVELQRTNRAICCAKWSPRENKFAFGSSDKNIGICYWENNLRFWAMEKMKKSARLTVTCVAWHPNNQLLAVGSCDFRCRVYSAYIKEIDGEVQPSRWASVTNVGELLYEFTSETGWLHSVAFSPSGNKLVWVAHDSTIFAVSSQDPRVVTSQTTPYLPFRCLLFINDSSFVVAGHEYTPMIYQYDEQKRTIGLVDTLSQQEIPSTPTKTGIESEFFSPSQASAFFEQAKMTNVTPEMTSIHQNLITQMLPYHAEGANVTMISSTDVFGQLVIWNLNNRKLKK